MTDYDGIKAAVFDYYDGYNTKDRAKLEGAFALDVARMTGYWADQDGVKALRSKPMREVIDTWTDPDYTLMPFGEGKILSVHQFSDDGATVVFDCGGVFLDTFQMVKMDGTWRIVNKAFVDL